MLTTLLLLAALSTFYKFGGFGCLITAAERATEEPQEAPRPQRITAKPAPPQIDRGKLERIAQNCLSACGVSFDTYYYVRNKSDVELMDIITEYNLKE